MKFTNKQGKIRLYDGSTTPFYLEIDFDAGDFSGPMGIPKTEETLVLDRGNMTADAHYVEGSVTKVMEPVAVSFTGAVTDDTQSGLLLDWMEQLSNGDSASPVKSSGTVNSNTLTSTQGDTQRDGVNGNPLFADGTKMTCNIEYRLDSTTDIVFHYNEVLFPLDGLSISEAEDGVTIAFAGLCYGTITRDTAFTAGTSVEV
ncbi:MAG: hypothetical protein M0P69_11170 [Bacteroidales bacterium]|nr:hypothetical protein [Bacteroidales bacterium]